MAEAFVGIVIVKCNCDHAVAGAPINVRVKGGNNVECDAGGVTNAFGYFIFKYRRRAYPVDVHSMEGKVVACGQEVAFASADIARQPDWEAVVARISAARCLPRSLCADDLKAQVECLAPMSPDSALFSTVIEVDLHCHDDSRTENPHDHGAESMPVELVTIPDLRIFLRCSAPDAEEISGTLYGMGFSSTAQAAQQKALDRALELAEARVRQVQAQYACAAGCALQAAITYEDHRASFPTRYDSPASGVQYMSLGVIGWKMVLGCG